MCFWQKLWSAYTSAYNLIHQDRLNEVFGKQMDASGSEDPNHTAKDALIYAATGHTNHKVFFSMPFISFVLMRYSIIHCIFTVYLSDTVSLEMHAL